MKRATLALALAALWLAAAPAHAADLAAARAAMTGPPSGWPQALADVTAAARGGAAGAVEAAYLTGLMVRNGRGCAADSAAAAIWLEQAARGGVPEAMFVLANMRIAGEAGPADAVAGRTWLERAAALGHPAALQQLAQMAHEAGAGERANALIRESAHAMKHRAESP
jgi:TPR repeat protein